MGTVSRFLNGERLRDANRRRVERAITELGYRQSFPARTLKTGRTYSVATVVAGFNEFHSGVIASLGKTLARRGYHLIICEHERDPVVLGEQLGFLLERQIDGLVLSSSTMDLAILREYQERNVPLVVYNEMVRGLPVDSVNTDNAPSAFRATRYLWDMGHRIIGFIGGTPGSHTAEERLRGYAEALAASRGTGTRRVGEPDGEAAPGSAGEARGHREPPAVGGPDGEPTVGDGLVAVGDWTGSGGYAATLRLLAAVPHPTALISANYNMTTGVLRALRESGRRIPQDISLISFGDPDYFQAYRPPITAVRQPIDQIAGHVADLLLRRMAGDRDGLPEDHRLDCEQIIRGSVRRID